MLHSVVWPAVVVCSAMTLAGFAEDQKKDAAPAKKKETAPRITSTVDLKQVSTMSDHEARHVSLAAGRILKHVAKARHALSDKKLDMAKTHVDQGLKLVTIIDGLLPRYVIKTEIKSGEHAYSDEDVVVPDLVTVFSELEAREIVAPVLEAKTEQAQKSGAQPATKSPPAPSYVISHEDIQYSAIKLDVALAARLLNTAKTELMEEKSKLADDALLAIQTRAVLFEREEIDLPLKEATDNLTLAERELRQGHHEHAAAALHVASDQLKLYEKKTGETRSAEVKALHAEIDKLAAELHKGPVTEAQSQKHASTISDWWQRATKWFKSKK